MTPKEILVKPNMTSYNREHVLLLVKTAMESGSFRFARQTALAWLAAFPGDLEINVWYARALIKEERLSHAVPVIEKVIRSDPEYLFAAQTADEIFSALDEKQAIPYRALVQALGGAPSSMSGLPAWGPKLFLANNALNNKEFEHASALIYSVLGDPEDPMLAGIYHLRLTELQADPQTTLNLAKIYHDRWPECVHISLIYAKSMLAAGDNEDAVYLLHQCAAADCTAQVPTRMWGEQFPFKPLYAVKMDIPASFAIPSEVAGKLGFNALAAGPAGVAPAEVEAQKTAARTYDGFKVNPEKSLDEIRESADDEKAVSAKDEVIFAVEKEFDKIAEKLRSPKAGQKDSRFPAYVILSTRRGLENQFGVQTSQAVIAEMQTLAARISSRSGWSSFAFLPDDLEVSGKYGITPVDTIDPWKIKLALADLDKALAKKGEMIGSVLIVGSDQVVPFHKLPNPTDDDDAEVPSDNPYATLDTNYFVSDWPVGRLPGESGSDAGLLLEELRNTIQYHTDEIESETWLNKLIRLLLFWDKAWAKQFSNSAYTAAVWQRSSLAAFRPLGEGRNLATSPKGTVGAFDLKSASTAPFSYYNLHGVADGSDWYGQKDSADKNDGPDYPVALRAADVAKLTSYSRIVYSEACYGGHVVNKTEKQSMALSMLGVGALGLVGSTTISYGSVTTPLIGADLLGYLMMKYLRDGVNLGMAFTYAKVDFVSEMNRRQGYLDAEDQKTLISFVLYGDPLVAYDPYQAMKKSMNREKLHPVAKTVTDYTEVEAKSIAIPQEAMTRAKAMVREYLPGIEYAEVKISHQMLHGANSAHQAAGSAGSSTRTSRQANRVIVTFSKQVDALDKSRHQYARVTMDNRGKVVKLAVSR